MRLIGLAVAAALSCLLFSGCGRPAPLTSNDFVDLPALLAGTWEGEINYVRAGRVAPVVFGFDLVRNNDGSRNLRVMYGDPRTGMFPISYEAETDGSSVVVSFRDFFGSSAKLRLFDRDNLTGIWRNAGSSSIVAGTDDRIRLERLKPLPDPTDLRRPLVGVWEGTMAYRHVVLRVDPQGSSLRVMLGTRSGVYLVEHRTEATPTGLLIEINRQDGGARLTLTERDSLSGTWLRASDKRLFDAQLDRLQ